MATWVTICNGVVVFWGRQSECLAYVGLHQHPGENWRILLLCSEGEAAC